MTQNPRPIGGKLADTTELPLSGRVGAQKSGLPPLEVLLKVLSSLPDAEKEALERELARLEEVRELEACRTRFLPFVQHMWPIFIAGRHHKIMASAFERVAKGELKRLIINMPPRHTKSEFASWLLPAWYLGQYPGRKVIQTSHTAELAVGFGRKVRNLVDTAEYNKVFPKLQLQADSKAAGRWNTSAGGDYFAIGVGGAVTGKGADLLIIDDPHSEQEAALAVTNPEVYDSVYEWYTSGPRQRLQPGGAIVIVMTRWSLRDLTGRVLKAAAQRGGEQWEVIEFPAILPSGNALWPEFWSLEELHALKDELPNPKWQAQYQQNPVGDEGAIVKREWWKKWPKDNPPQCEFILQTWDTAFEKTNRSDYSACTTWGIFSNEEDGTNHIILLDAYKRRMEWVELKKEALRLYREWEPDGLLVEKKASGSPLIYELRSQGIPVQEYTPSKGQDKVARLNSVADIIASGKVWVPERPWAEELMDEVASFPSGEHDDLVDATTLALMRFRAGGFLRLPSDEPEEVREFRSPRSTRFY